MEDVTSAVLVSEYYPEVFPKGAVVPAPVGKLTPLFHDIAIENVKATGSKLVGVIVGLPEAPVKNITLRNVSIQAQTSAWQLTSSRLSSHSWNPPPAAEK